MSLLNIVRPYVAQDDFKLETFLPSSPKSWDHRHVLAYPTDETN